MARDYITLEATILLFGCTEYIRFTNNEFFFFPSLVEPGQAVSTTTKYTYMNFLSFYFCFGSTYLCVNLHVSLL